MSRKRIVGNKNRIDIYTEISKNIRKNRKKFHLTQREVAELAGYSHDFIRRIEAKNCIKSFSLETVYEISLAIGVPMMELVKIETEKKGECMNNNFSFFELCKEEFISLVSNISLELRITDVEYKKADFENRMILTNYPKLCDILAKQEVDGLSKEECDAMARYLDNGVYLKYKEFEELFFKGYKEAYFYFSKSGLLRLESNEKK